ncbi:hypothetical protein J5N97_004379 [Dioscorea zingiberensis]|uniref:Uncharacterized protein n=1 Tax=Dioscorea zingiberensis TaxID=325984 RepID=A0A9D5D6I8_9LILI|nr:hypothetical protein J5N97_004379 [Dioscorea zingiberensis]
MKETIRCCISCILPCGALDVVRIVHANGRVEEISHAVRAADVLQAYPKHVLRKPPSSSLDDDDDSSPQRAVIVQPTAELQRGKIYFLMPVAAPAPEKQKIGRRRRKKREMEGDNGVLTDRTRLLVSDQYLSEILSEKVSSQRDRRRGRVAVWRPHLESISEASNDL